MLESVLEWKKELPSEEGIYMVKDLSGSPRKVRIINDKIDDNPERPDNLHVYDGSDYYDLSIENGCSDWLWAKVNHKI